MEGGGGEVVLGQVGLLGVVSGLVGEACEEGIGTGAGGGVDGVMDGYERAEVLVGRV